MDYTKEAVTDWAKGVKSKAQAENEAFLATLAAKHSEMGWNGHVLSKNDYFIRIMDKLIGAMQQASDDWVQDVVTNYQALILAEHVMYTGEGHQNPAHTVVEYGKACARSELLRDLDGYLYFDANKFRS